MTTWIPSDNIPAPLQRAPIPLLGDERCQMSFGERAALEGVLSQLQPALSLEIGTYEGGSLRLLAAHSGHVHTLDLEALVPDTDAFSNVTFHVGDSREILPSLLARLSSEGSAVDFVLVDGDHSADGVERDLTNVLDSPCARHSIIMLHDMANSETRAGVERVDFAAREHVIYVELDFVGGYEFRGGHFGGQVWGGLGLVVTGDSRADPYRENPRQRRYVEAFAARQAEHARVEALGAELARTEEDLALARGWLASIQASASWRLTRPLRDVKQRARSKLSSRGTPAARRLPARPETSPEPVPSAPVAQPEPDHVRRDREDNYNMRRLVGFLLRAGDNCIDVGAHHGGLLEEICRVAPSGHHVAFEPLPHLAQELRERFPDVEVRNAAASNRAGNSTFAHIRAAEGWSSLKYRPLPGNAEADLVEITVALERIDEVVDPDFAPRLLKIDVEGAEQQVLEGALETLRRHRPVVLFEHGLGSADAYGTTPDDIWHLLVDEVGLRVFDLDGNGPYDLERLRRTFYEASRVNFVAHP